MEQSRDLRGRITYEKLFWVFMAGSVLGVIIEGSFYVIRTGHWESHVVSLVGQFNVLYGAGAILFFVIATLLKDKSIVLKTVLIMLIATVLELLCGLLLADAIGMKAWDYSKSFMNYRGLICLSFTLFWGVAGLIFCLLYDRIDGFLCKLNGKAWHIACVALSVFMVINLALTAMAIGRWSSRHYGSQANGIPQQIADRYTPDDWMQSRFVEWSFLD